MYEHVIAKLGHCESSLRGQFEKKKGSGFTHTHQVATSAGLALIHPFSFSSLPILVEGSRNKYVFPQL